MTKTTRINVTFTSLFLGLIVAVFLLEFIAPTEFLTHGLTPRTQRGLPGIVTMPFLHANFAHLTANLASLVVLMSFMLAFHSDRLIGVVILVILIGGLLLWIFGRPAIHIGASGLIYGLAVFIVVFGIVQRRFFPVVGAIAVAVIYGNALFWGLLPIHPGISWDGHLAGAMAGAIVGLRGIRQRELPA